MNINTALTTSTGWLRPARLQYVCVCVPELTRAICTSFIPSALLLARREFGEPWVQNSCFHTRTHTHSAQFTIGTDLSSFYILAVITMLSFSFCSEEQFCSLTFMLL